MKIEGSRSLVTGGSEGIGKAIAQGLVERGGKVAILARRKDVLEKAAKEIGAVPIVGDVAREEDCVRAVKTAVDALGGLDLLVNNAGYGYFAPLVEMDVDRFRDLYAVNVTGAMLMAREAARYFLGRGGGGNVVNISSTSGTKGGRNSTAYASSKFALKGMTECWRDELRRHDVRVFLVNPSEVITDFASKAGFGQEPSPKKLRGREIADAVIGALLVDDRGFIPEFSVFATNPF